MKGTIFLASLVSFVAIATQSHAQYFDQYGHPYTGNAGPDGGHLDMLDSNGTHYDGVVSPGGHIDIYGSDGSYSPGQVQPEGHIDVFR